MYFYKDKGKQYLDLTGNLIITFNDDPVRTRAQSAAPAGIKQGKFIEVKKLNFFKRIKATLTVLAFIWGGDKALKREDTNYKEPVRKPDTETEGRENCPVINKHCEHYAYQCDNNGEVAIDYCKHPKNKSDTEGNATPARCPLV